MVQKRTILTLPKMNGYIKTFKDKDRNKQNKLMFFRIDDEKLLEKCKIICTKIKDVKNIKLNALPVYDDEYINCLKYHENARKTLLR